MCLILYRAEKQMINEKIKEGDQPEEVDDSGFYAGKKIVPSFHNLVFLLSHLLLLLVSTGGLVPQVGVTITMDDDALNGTNRVVLDGVMTEKECDKILQLATVIKLNSPSNTEAFVGLHRFP